MRRARMCLAGCLRFPAGRSLRLLAVVLSGLLALTPLALGQERETACGRGAENEFDEERWKPADDGTVGDEENGIVWKQCPEGLRGERCRDGRLKYVTWEQALEIAEKSTFAGYDDWRIPKLDELRQIIQSGCLLPVVNLAIFPNTPSGWFWYDSAEDDNSPRAGQLGFAFGEDFSANQRNVVHLRLMREVPDKDDAEADAAAGGAAANAGQPDDAQAGAQPAPDAPDAAGAGQEDAADGQGVDQAVEPGTAAEQAGEPAVDQAGDQPAEPPGGPPGGEPPGDQDAGPAAGQPAGDNPDQPDARPAGADGAGEPGLLPGPAPAAPPAAPAPDN